MAREILQLGWREVGKRGLAFEAFCIPSHREVLQRLSSIRTEMLAGIGQMRWSVDVTGKLQPLDSTKGIPQRFVNSVQELADLAVRDMTKLLENIHAMEIEEVTSTALTILVDHDGEIAEAILQGELNMNEVIAIDFDRGSPIVVTTAPVREYEKYEYDESGLVVCATFPVPDLPSAMVRWDVNHVRITLPGVPSGGPLVGWTMLEDSQEIRVRRIVMESVGSLVNTRTRLPFGKTANAVAR